MTKKKFLRAVWALPLVSLCQAAGAAYIQLDFNGTLTNIMVQAGTGVYSGVTAGSNLSGSVRYGLSAGDAAWVESAPPVEQEWGFVGSEYGASYNVDGVVLGASDSKLSITNDLALPQAYVDVLTAAGISATVGQTVDFWSLPVDGDSLHQNPVDPTGPYVGGQEWGLVLLDLDGTMLSNTDFLANTASLTGIDYALLTVLDTAEDGTVLFEGVGLLNSLTPTAVPLPATAYLFGTGLIGLAGLGQRKTNRGQTTFFVPDKRAEYI